MVSVERKVIYFHSGLTLWRGGWKRALPGGSPVSARRFVLGPRLPVSVAPEASLLTGPQVIRKQIMETNSVCLPSPHAAVALCRRAHGCT